MHTCALGLRETLGLQELAGGRASWTRWSGAEMGQESRSRRAVCPAHRSGPGPSGPGQPPLSPASAPQETPREDRVCPDAQ